MAQLGRSKLCHLINRTIRPFPRDFQSLVIPAFPAGSSCAAALRPGCCHAIVGWNKQCTTICPRQVQEKRGYLTAAVNSLGFQPLDVILNGVTPAFMTKRTPPPEPRPDPSLVDLYERPLGLGILMRAELVMMTVYNGTLQFLMFEREQEPYDRCFSLPGRYLNEDLSLEQIASSVGKRLKVNCGTPQLFRLYSHPDRNRQHRAISATYLCVANRSSMIDLTQRDPRFKLVSFDPRAADAYMEEHAPFAPDPSAPALPGTNFMVDGHPLFMIAFDHAAMIRDAFIHLHDTLDHTMLAFGFLPAKFTLFELQKVYEAIRLQPLEKNLFRKRMRNRIFANGMKLRPCDDRRATAGRPAQLYELYRPPKPEIAQGD